MPCGRNGVESNYAEEPALAAAASCLAMDAQTTPDDEEEEIAPAADNVDPSQPLSQAGLGGAGLTEGKRSENIAAAAPAPAGGGAMEFCGLTGRALVDL